jgi:hypothetical protein
MHTSHQINHQDLFRMREPSLSFPLVAFLHANRKHEVLHRRRNVVGRVHAWIGSPPFDVFEKLLAGEQVYKAAGGDVVFSYEGFDFVGVDSGESLVYFVDGFGLGGFDEGVS